MMQLRQTRVLADQRAWGNPSRSLVLVGVAICLTAFLWTLAGKPFWHSNLLGTTASANNADSIDQRLQRAAVLALGNRQGTVIVMDPQSGRVRAVVNPRLAFEQELPPGSTIKPFTTLAALRSKVINEDSRTLCHEEYEHDEFHTVCSHPRELPPLNPTDALAYSCNYFFGKVGESLAEASFVSTLDEFGFGEVTGVNAANEASGSLRRNQWRTQNAIGEGDYIRATPMQVVSAYSALVNGGQLFTPRVERAVGFVPQTRARVTIDPDERELIVKGMRGAVRYGTAETAHLYSLPPYVFGKTGTATEINGYRSQGWFVGFASVTDGQAKELAPEHVRLAVLVFLARAHGSDAAETARGIFAEYSRSLEEYGNAEHARPDEIATEINVSASPRRLTTDTARHVNSSSSVRIHLVRENVTRVTPIEEYVRGVVAAEGSLEREAEALKALAVASRSYALKNLGRHAKDGYDFCTTTHCQRFQSTSGASDKISAAVDDAVNSTAGEVLRDGDNQIADTYFSASCGGATANVATLWGGSAPQHLRGVKDNACLNEAHHSWTDIISSTDLNKALQTDQRTTVGAQLNNVSVLRQDASGRAEVIALDGDYRKRVKGWDFKIVVGRALGWNLLKSSRFEIIRAGSKYVFRGSGFGHGLGLCQEGAHVMAAHGSNYRQILAKYFPSTYVGNNLSLADLVWSAEPITVNTHKKSRGNTGRQWLRSEDFRISYPTNVSRQEVEDLLRLLQANRQSLMARVAAAGIRVQPPTLEIFINETTGDFVGRTGQPAWAAAATNGNTVDLQPLTTLKRRRILETTVVHELVHALVETIGRGRTPRWLGEGLALHLAREGRLVARYQPGQRMTVEEIEQQLGQTTSPDKMRAAYAAAYGEVKKLIASEGEANVWRLVAR